MPFPLAPYVSTMIKAQLTAAGAPGAIGLGAVTQTPINPLHLMTDVMVQTCWPSISTNFLGGLFVGSLGSVSSSVSPPVSLPFIDFRHVKAAVEPLLPIVMPTAEQLSIQNLWTGPFALAVPTAVGMGVLMALNSSPLTISGAVGDATFINLTGGFLEYQRTPLTAAAFLGQVQAAWAATPDIGPSPHSHLLLANAMVGALIEPVNALQLSCGIVNATPPAVAIVPGTYYPHTAPLVFT